MERVSEELATSFSSIVYVAQINRHRGVNPGDA
jgi:hypothetical protein